MLEHAINNFVAKLLAKEIEVGAALSREMGFNFPKKYDFGFVSKMAANKSNTRFWMHLKLRVVDVVRPFSIELGETPVEGENAQFVESLFQAAHDMVQAYLDEHPELAPDGATAKMVRQRLRADPDAIMKDAAAAAKTATYTREGGL